MALSIVLSMLGTCTAFAEEVLSDDVVEISTLAELELFRDRVNGGETFEGKTVRLTADIDMSARYGKNKQTWTPIGCSSQGGFAGTFDGNGHLITNLYVLLGGNDSSMEAAGLFGVNNGTIRKLFVQGSLNNTLSGGTGGIAGSSMGKIEQCAFTGYVESACYAGGIAGVNSGEITDCCNTSTIMTERYGGGIVGMNESGMIVRCHNVGKVKVEDGITEEFFGSIVGYGSAENIADCYYLEGTYLKGVCTDAENAAAWPLTEDQFKDQVHFSNWDFDNVWIMDADAAMPVLRARTVPAAITEIYTAQDLKDFRDSVNSGNTYTGKTVKLMADIELNITEPWMPIGGVCYLKNQKNGVGRLPVTAFSGVFDGQNHTVSGINACECFGSAVFSMGKEYQGFFGYVSYGAIKNLTVKGVIRDGMYLSEDTFSRKTYIGGAAAFLSGSDISNVHSYMDIVLTENAARDSYAGGVAGELDYGSVAAGCTNHGDIEVSGNSLKSKIGQIGGILGDISSYSSAERCVNYGSITLRGNTVAGGISGQIHRNTDITNCANYGTITVAASGSGYIGGITGRVHGFKDDPAEVINCLNTGKMICAGACTGGVISGASADYDIPNLRNNYYLDTSIDMDAESGNQGDSVGKTAAELASGETAYLLGEAWGQEISVDRYPVPGGKKVYRIGSENHYKYVNTDPDDSGTGSGGGSGSSSSGAAGSGTGSAGGGAGSGAVSGTTEGAVSFIDVKTGDYFDHAVAWAVGRGITSGTSRTTFSPEDFCTRAQAITFLWKAFGAPKAEKTQTRFIDIQPDDYYYDAVCWAVEKGITSGTSETAFSPDCSVTRAQAVTLLYRAAGSPKQDNGSGDVIGKYFTDVDESAYYCDSVYWAIKEGITSGTSEMTFSPKQSCSRAQIVTFLFRCAGTK